MEPVSAGQPIVAASVCFNPIAGADENVLSFSASQSGEDGVSLRIMGVRGLLFINGKKFRALTNGALSSFTCEPTSDGGSLLRMHLTGTSAEVSAGVLSVVLPRTNSSVEDWTLEQFKSDLSLLCSNSSGGGTANDAGSKRTKTIAAPPWLHSVTFTRGKKAEFVHEHPDELIEHEAVRGVTLPELNNLQLALPLEIVSQGRLSIAQLQTVCLAARSFSTSLPTESHAIDTSNASGAASMTRCGFLLGDGTGCGKGRIIAALLAHVALTKRPFGEQSAVKQSLPRRCLWVSTSRDLFKDANRDITDTLGSDSPLRLFEEQDVGNVRFATYAKLRSSVKEFQEWLGGADADGLIVFDEAHHAKTFVPGNDGQSSLQARAVNEIQQGCPRAAVLYVSATAANGVAQMAYMQRLGLWGAGTPFADFLAFRSSVESFGIDGMQAVALQLRSLGRATCRALSVGSANVNVSQALPDSERLQKYDNTCQFLASVRSKALCIHEEEPLTPIDFKRFESALGSLQLRLFRQLVLSMKVPEIIRKCNQALSDERQVIIGLWSTGEAQLAALAESTDSETAPSSPEIMLDQFLSRHFPSPPEDHARNIDINVEEFTPRLNSMCASDLSKEAREALIRRACSEWELPSDAPLDIVGIEKNAMHGADPIWRISFSGTTRAEITRESLRAQLRAIELPVHPIDELIDALGGPCKVAELSGRSSRLLRDVNGSWEIVPRLRDARFKHIPSSINNQEWGAFQSSTKRVAIITEAASTGISLHSDRKLVKIGHLPRPRTMIVAELGVSAEQTVQQLGRVHRSNQLYAPRIDIVLAPVPGEARIAYVLYRRLRSLGAVTRGLQNGADAVGGGDLGHALVGFDMNHYHMGAALNCLEASLLRDPASVLNAYRADPVSLQSLCRVVIDLCASSSDAPDEGDVQSTGSETRFFGRLLSLPVPVQQDIIVKLRAHLEELEANEPIESSEMEDSIKKASILSNELFHISVPPLQLLKLDIRDSDGKDQCTREGVRSEWLLTGPVLTVLALVPSTSSDGQRHRLTRRRTGADEVVSGIALNDAEVAALRELLASICAAEGVADQNRDADSALRALRALFAHLRAASDLVSSRAGDDAAAEAEEDRGPLLPVSDPVSDGTAPESASLLPSRSAKRPRDVAAAAAPPAQSQRTTCLARTWAGGLGTQCTRSALQDHVFCKIHQKEADRNRGVPSHGRIDGPIPNDKQKAFSVAEAMASVAPAMPSASNLAAEDEQHDDQRMDDMPTVSTVPTASRSRETQSFSAPTSRDSSSVTVGNSAAASSSSTDNAAAHVASAQMEEKKAPGSEDASQSCTANLSGADEAAQPKRRRLMAKTLKGAALAHEKALAPANPVGQNGARRSARLANRATRAHGE
eukprot:TRINITY_DN28567_c1_g1_i1.p1 TRINITY_DN28567_c1_g1~~TRINITY_DN28567_c1_g1_i1.p1  ORF type:complete len:1389 (+),score=158.32 TRINITY_DN28567_c1_g1_i1:38-4204(+)